jgi:hypothetical protein
VPPGWGDECLPPRPLADKPISSLKARLSKTKM